MNVNFGFFLELFEWICDKKECYEVIVNWVLDV